VFIEGRNEATNVTVGDIKEFRDFKAEFEKNLVLSFGYLLFEVVVFVRVEFEFSDIFLSLVHLGKQKDTLKRKSNTAAT
jgi:hypothetical protein